MIKPKRLSPQFVRSVSEPGRYSDGPRTGGLSLLVRRCSDGYLSKRYQQRLHVNGQQANYAVGHAEGLGSITLSNAREIAAMRWVDNKRGNPPAKTGRWAKTVPTFAEVVREVYELDSPGWSDNTKRAWHTALDTHVLPKIGKRSIDAVTTPELLKFIGPLHTSTPGACKAATQRMGRVFKFAVGKGYRSDNPCDSLKTCLPKSTRKVEHRKAAPHAEVRGLLELVRECDKPQAARSALEFLVLTACRTDEVRGADWSEIDLDAATWTIPAGRMKGGIAHIVTLSRQAIELLRERPNREELIFEGQKRGKPFGEAALRQVLTAIETDVDVHGFRSSFRDWVGETGRDETVAEKCLAHKTGSATQQAYARSSLLARRRELMQEWGAYVLG